MSTLASQLPGIRQAQALSLLPPPSLQPSLLPPASGMALLNNPTMPILGSSVPQGLPALPAPTLPNVLGPGPSQLSMDTAKRDQMVANGSGISQIKNPVLRGIASAVDIAGSVFAPRLEGLLPGTQGHHDVLVHQQNALINQDQAQAAADTAQQDAQAQVQQRQAQAQQEAAKAQADLDPRKAVDPSKTVQTDDGVYQLNPDSGKYDIRVGDRADKPKAIEEQAYEYAISQGASPMEAYAQVTGARSSRDANLPQQYLDAMSSGDTAKAALIRRTIQDTSTAPRIQIQQAAAADRPESTGTWTTGFDANKNPVMFNSKTGEIKPMEGTFSKNTTGNAKIGADEQKRGDLAQNMNENIDQLEDILQRRPELFGPVAGRLTEAKAALGTSDPDVSKLFTLEHQLGMVAQGAHGMRSAQGVESAAKSLVNGFKNSPEATRAAIEAARTSVHTFISNTQSPGQARTDGGLSVTAPDGSVHSFSNQAAADKFKQLAGIK